MPQTKRVVLVQPRSTGGNFEYVAIPRQGMLFLSAALHQFDGLAFLDSGQLVQRPFRRMIPSDYVELPDYTSIRDLTPQNPMAAGVLETSRGCTESCTYCEVIEQFVGYRMVKPE